MNQYIMSVWILLGTLSFETQASTFTDSTAFINAVNALGLNIVTENYESYSTGPLTNGQNLGMFNYTFDPNQTQPAVVPDGNGGQALGGAPFDVFVGGDTVKLSYTDVNTLVAFGAEFSYAPNFEDLPADLYQLTILDGLGAGTAVGNPAGLSGAGGAFFLGFIEPAGFEFRGLSILSRQPLDNDGNPYLTPAYQVDNLMFVASVPSPSVFPLFIVGLAFMAFLQISRQKDSFFLSNNKIVFNP